MTSTQFDVRLGANVAHFRRAAGLSQTRFAEALTERGFSFQQQTILKVERGARPLKANELPPIADIFGVTVAELLADEGLDWTESDTVAHLRRDLREANRKLKMFMVIAQPFRDQEPEPEPFSERWLEERVEAMPAEELQAIAETVERLSQEARRLVDQALGADARSLAKKAQRVAEDR